ncbi:MAG TPA: hypothetical protein VKV19_10475 [Ktedonobacteraceae bacterium]|nr:hypothetical protein [Ktedonobacteraceae bacterium]
MGKRLGLIIGVNSYQDATFRPLQFAETDARALAQWLVHGRGGNWNPADVQVLLGTEATRELAENLIGQLCLQRAGPEDLVVIYFAGYAFVDQISGDGYLACSNTYYQQSGSGIHVFSLVGQVMAQSRAAQILCILDCFQFGQLWNRRRGTPFDYKPLLGPIVQSGLQQIQGRLLYCTCRGSEMAPEMGEKNLGSFMYRLIMGVGGPAVDPATGQVTLQGLHTFLSQRLDDQHRPQVFGREPRPLVLVGEMPSFGTGALHSESAMAQLSPSASGLAGLPPLAPSDTSSLGQGQPAPDQNLLMQCQQMLSQARQLVQMQSFQQAYQLTETILQVNPTFVDGLILKGQILGSVGQFQEALDVVKRVVDLDPNNALGWSMAAALLANTGQFPEAMLAVDRSLSIDPSNGETVSLKEMIREKLAEAQLDTGKRSRLRSPEQKPRDNAPSFALAAGIQLVALIAGVAGAFLPLLVPSAKVISILLESLALAVLVVNGWRGSYLYGVKRFLITLVFSLLTGGLFGGLILSLYKTTPFSDFLVRHLSSSFSTLTPLTILTLWLAAAAALPLLSALIGLIAGIIARARRK